METLQFFNETIDQIQNDPTVYLEEQIVKFNLIIDTLQPKSTGQSMYEKYSALLWQATTFPAEFLAAQLEFYNNEKTAYLEYLQSLKNDLYRAIDKERDRHIFADITYNFPDTNDPEKFYPDIIDLRDERDRQNIQDLCISALHDIINNQPNNICCFMPKSNQLKLLTATQMADLGDYVKNRGEAIYGDAWYHKMVVASLNSEKELLEYDYTQGWSF